MPQLQVLPDPDPDNPWDDWRDHGGEGKTPLYDVIDGLGSDVTLLVDHNAREPVIEEFRGPWRRQIAANHARALTRLGVVQGDLP